MDDLISRQALSDAMYHEAFEKDTDMQKWDSGCWIRYKLFENVLRGIPSVDAVEIVTEYCRKRNLVIITMESFRVLQAYYNRQNGMDGET